MSQWKRWLQDGASELFARGKQIQNKEQGLARKTDLVQQGGFAEPDDDGGCRDRWRNSPMCLRFCGAREYPMLVDIDDPEISVSGPCALLGLPAPTLGSRAPRKIGMQLDSVINWSTIK